MGLDMHLKVEKTIFDELSYHRNSWILWEWFVHHAKLDPVYYDEQKIPQEVIKLFLNQSAEALADKTKKKLKEYFPCTGKASNENYENFLAKADLINLRRAILYQLAENPETVFFLRYDY